MGCYLDLGVVGVLEAYSGVMLTEKNFEDWTEDSEGVTLLTEMGMGHNGPFCVQGQGEGGHGRVRGEKRCWKRRTYQRQPGSSTTKLV